MSGQHGGARPGAGRKPSQEKAKTRPLKTSDAEWTQIQANAEKAGMTVNAWLRQLGSEGVEYFGRSADKEVYNQLQAIRLKVSNINGALQYFCYPDKGLDEHLTEAEIQKWSCLVDVEELKEMLSVLINNFDPY